MRDNKNKADFYAKKELQELYKAAAKKRYSTKEDWEKFLSNQASKNRKKKLRRLEMETLDDNMDNYRKYY